MIEKLEEDAAKIKKDNYRLYVAEDGAVYAEMGKDEKQKEVINVIYIEKSKIEKIKTIF